MNARKQEAAALTLPDGPLSRRSAAPADGAPRSVADFADSALSWLERQAASGDPVATGVLALSPQDGAEGFKSAIAQSVPAPDRREDDVPSTLYAAAVKALAAARVETAVALLAPLAFENDLEPDPLVGLAVCAARMDRFAEASLLAQEAIRRGSKHPRAFCVAGLCELERGDKNAARDRLALAARLARRDPAFRDDLRAAQRMLLTLHFG